MKKYFIFLMTGLSIGLIQAQDISDALRYSQSNINGTARFRAMGGAFTALGGDLSAISLNPASSVVFNNNQAGFTLVNYNVNNKSDYFGTERSRSKTSFDVNQAGVVFVFKNYDEESKWKKFAVSVNYDNLANFNNKTYTQGINTNSSIGDYFLNQANGVSLDMLQVGGGYSPEGWYERLGNYANGSQLQNAFLGYHTYLIEANNNNPDNEDYYSNIPTGVYNQSNVVTQSGYNGKVNFNFATQYTDRFHFGINLNAHVVNYAKTNSFLEYNSNSITDPLEEVVRDVYYETDLYTYGTGFSFQLGGIFKVTNGFRLGASYESSTWYRLNDELKQYISVLREQDVANPNGELVEGYFYSPSVQIFPEYTIQTPSKYTVGGAYVFGNKGLVSVDYSVKDYSSTQLKSDSDDFYSSQNQLMEDVLTTAYELRVGAEAKVKEWSFRGGYNFEQSPFENGKTVGDLQQYSLGFGYNFGATKLDLTYSRSQREYNQSLFTAGLTDAPNIEMTTDNVFLTLLFEF